MVQPQPKDTTGAPSSGEGQEGSDCGLPASDLGENGVLVRASSPWCPAVAAVGRKLTG